MAITVIIGDSDAQPLAWLTQAYLLRDFGECSVLIIVEHERGNGLEEIGMTICPVAFLVLPAPDILEIPIRIAEDNQIQESVPVQIHPCRAGRPAASSHTRLLGYIGECAIAVIVVELVSAVRGHVKIFEAVIVVVANG